MLAPDAALEPRDARIVFQVDPSEPHRGTEREVLQVGATRTPLLERLAPRWRLGGVALGALVLGVIGGGGAAWWWNEQRPPETRAATGPAAAGTEVRLILSRVATLTRPEERLGAVGNYPLRIDAVLLHSRGPGTATVTRIHRPGTSIAIRAEELPVALSANRSFERVRLEVTPRDCRLATEWTPSSQPFTLTWRDEQGDVHTDTGGDHDASLEVRMLEYFDRVCGSAATS